MARPSEIRQKGFDKVVAELALTHSEQQIVDFLAEKHSFKTSKSAVHRIVTPLRKEAGELVRAKVNKQVDEDLPADLDQLNEIREVYRKIYQNEEARVCDRIQAADKARAVIDTKLKYSSAGSGGEGKGPVVTVYLPDNGRDRQ